MMPLILNSKGMERLLLYRLEGFETDWRQQTNKDRAYYYALPPGNYTFRVKASNLYGDLGTESLLINISPPWYLTWWAYVLYGLVFIGAVFAVDRIQRRRLLQKEREKNQQKELAQAREIEKAYNELKTTQQQLIHSEKMASLGELTAGIAHEIQNPLNFVNNFSEVNLELTKELEEEIEKGDLEEVKALSKDIRENEEKIMFHGKRAESIVKGMLLHSRSNSGEKLPIDINALADEYLRLAYHGMRARDKSFNVELNTSFDQSLGKVPIVPQEFGRVLLNILTNAFHAVQRKAASENGYLPEVTLMTKDLGDKLEIRIKDNGPGIPNEIKDKIFQPFFTTKPTGEGTGLGLSLSYDIVKAHGGEINVRSESGKGTEFTVILPTKFSDT